jgi:copper(I)-binding protein
MYLIRSSFRFAWFCLFLLITGCSDAEHPGISGFVVEDAWMRAPVPPLDKTAGYFKFSNRSATAVTLASATSARARTIEFHETFEKNGMLRMRRLGEIKVGPGESVEFKPGGKHLMIFGFTGSGERVPVSFEVVSADPAETLSVEISFELR